MAGKRLAAVKLELGEVSEALKRGDAYLGISGSDLSKYSNLLTAKELTLQNIVHLQAQNLRPVPPGPPATFDRCSLPKVVQHMLDYEAVPSESTKALRALATLAYNDVKEVADHNQATSQLLRLLQLHPEEQGLQLAATKCLCHLAFNEDVAERLAEPRVLEALGRSDLATAAEATARIVAACAARRSPALRHVVRAPSLPKALESLDLEDSSRAALAEHFAAAPLDAAWLTQLAALAAPPPALRVPGAAERVAGAMRSGLGDAALQLLGVKALQVLAAAQGPEAVEAGVKSVEAAMALKDVELRRSCIDFLVSALDWPLELQKRCAVDYPRMASLTLDAMREHLEAINLQVTALTGLAKLVETLSCSAEVKALGVEGLIKTVLAHHKEEKEVWTWGRVLLDALGLDRNWTLR